MMKMKNWRSVLFLLAGVVLFTSCHSLSYFKYYNIYLNVKDLNGLKDGAVILSKGNQVGKVESIKVLEEGNLAILSIDNDFLIPKNSEIRVVSDIENTSAYLEIIMSHSKSNYQKGDTVLSQGTVLLNKDIQLEEVQINVDSLPEGIRTLLQ